jgi:hypothetical protein
MSTTSRGYRYPAATDAVNVNGDIQNLATDLNTDVGTQAAAVTANGTAISGLQTPPMLFVSLNGTVSLAGAAVWKLLPWDTEIQDTQNIWTAGSNPSRLLSPAPGKFVQFSGGIEFPSLATTSLLSIDVRLNSGGVVTGGTHLFYARSFAQNAPYTLGWSRPIRLMLSTDYVEVFFIRSDAAAANLGPGDYVTYAQLVKQSN